MGAALNRARVGIRAICPSDGGAVDECARLSVGWDSCYRGTLLTRTVVQIGLFRFQRGQRGRWRSYGVRSTCVWTFRRRVRTYRSEVRLRLKLLQKFSRWGHVEFCCYGVLRWALLMPVGGYGRYRHFE